MYAADAALDVCFSEKKNEVKQNCHNSVSEQNDVFFFLNAIS